MTRRKAGKGAVKDWHQTRPNARQTRAHLKGGTMQGVLNRNDRIEDDEIPPGKKEAMKKGDVYGKA